MRKDLRQRNFQIWRLRTLKKRKLKDIGEAYGITTERVRQIVARYERTMILSVIKYCTRNSKALWTPITVIEERYERS